MQLSFVTQINEADRLQWSGHQLFLQPTGLTATAATNPLAPARSNRAAASLAWVFVMASFTCQNGVMAVAVRQQLQAPHAAQKVMQQVPEQADTRKRHTALLSTQKKHKTAQQENSTSIQSAASTMPEFFQLDSDTEDNSSLIFPYVPQALLEDNMTSTYHTAIANASGPAFEQGSHGDHQQHEKTSSTWPWVRGKVVRKTSNAQEAEADIDSNNGNENQGHAEEAETDIDGNNGKESQGTSQRIADRQQLSGPVQVLLAGLRRQVMTDHRFMALPLVIAFLAITAFVCLYLFLSWRFGRTTGVRAQVEALRVSTSHDINELFQMKERYDCCHFQPISPGLVLRLQGTVTAGRQGKLVAPLSRQECVHFSASASTKRHDGIHAVPVAFHSVCVDFTITLLDAPDIQIQICGQDVALFDSTICVTEDQRRFSESTDHWQDFILTHRAPGVVGVSSAALRSENGLLEFREVALATGAVVTCMGELRQGNDGVLRLFPCGEVSSAQCSSGGTKPGENWRSIGENWRTSWERPETSSCMKTPEKVLISDDKRLLRTPRKGWACLNRHVGGKDQMLNDDGEDA